MSDLLSIATPQARLAGRRRSLGVRTETGIETTGFITVVSRGSLDSFRIDLPRIANSAQMPPGMFAPLNVRICKLKWPGLFLHGERCRKRRLFPHHFQHAATGRIF